MSAPGKLRAAARAGSREVLPPGSAGKCRDQNCPLLQLTPWPEPLVCLSNLKVKVTIVHLRLPQPWSAALSTSSSY